MPNTEPDSGVNPLRRLHVVAAVILGEADQVLIARRPDHLHQGGLWEFPGGKLEPDESPDAGLKRELQEELGIEVSAARPLMAIKHDYPEKQILLDVWLVNAFEGNPEGKEGQQVCWVALQSLPDYPFPPANAGIVEKILEEFH